MNTAELTRYSRQIIMPEIGTEGQEKLRLAKVLVIGAGGLGCPVLLYLTAAGVGTIGIVDFDNVDITNLHRQVLFGDSDVGKLKAETAAQKLKMLNPSVHFIAVNQKLEKDNALRHFEDYDIVVDGTDNFNAKYLINDACVILKKPLVSGSIFRFDGQVSVFNYRGGPTYRCLFPEPPDTALNCSEIGVMGVLPGIIGTLQANEVVKIITGTGDVLSGKLLVYDGLKTEFKIFRFTSIEANLRLKTLHDSYDFDTCGDSIIREPLKTKKYEADEPEKAKLPIGNEHFVRSSDGLRLNSGESEVQRSNSKFLEVPIKNISVQEFMKLKNELKDLTVIDVREPEEHKVFSVKSINVPVSKVKDNIDKIPKDKPVVIYCRSGVRSRKVIEMLQKEFDYKNLLNLEGGMKAWLQERVAEESKTG